MNKENYTPPGSTEEVALKLPYMEFGNILGQMRLILPK